MGKPESHRVADTGTDRREESKGSRANALRHGLTASKLLPEVLRGDRVARLRETLLRELNPSNAVESVLVNEMARHAGMLEVCEDAELAVLRVGARELASLTQPDVGGSKSDEEAILSAAVATDTLDRLSRYRRKHERAFYSAHEQFQEIKKRHRSETDSADANTCHTFDTESQCSAWLKRKFERPDWTCDRCGCGHGCWLTERQRWQCGKCKRQHSVRCGTVMERSRLPLVKWFSAIETILQTPGVTPAELAKQIGVSRRKTVLSLISRIHGALASSRSSELLAGLDREDPGNSNLR